MWLERMASCRIVVVSFRLLEDIGWKAAIRAFLRGIVAPN